MRSKPPTLAFGRPPKAKVPPARNLSSSLFYALFATLAGTNVVTAVGFLMSPDIAGLMSGQNDIVLSAYEDRIAQLRVEVDRLHSRQYAQVGDINLQLQDLAVQQEVLAEQHQYVRLLAEKASELGIGTDALPAAPEGVAVTAPVVSSPGPSADDEIAEAELAIRQMMEDTRMALVALSDAATDSTDDILAELRRIGIKPELPAATTGLGGPLLPADDGPDASSMLDDANAVMDALARFKAARDAIDAAPIHHPVAGKFRIGSGYGNRRDPFTRGKAFHAGLDFPAPHGTTVVSAGVGVVVFAGVRSGYGNLVEIDHGNGLVTRYGHLSKFLVKKGQTVRTGTPIAKVGSTGRSTGPHLHFEVRRDDKAVNPQPFLNAGKELQRYLV